MLKRNNCVYTQVVKHCSAEELLPIIRDLSDISKTEFFSVKLCDNWGAYDGLVDFLLHYACNASSGAKAHYRFKHSKNEFAKGKNHINGIENFWGYAKHRLAKFKGIKKENFMLHLKETEFRYNAKIQKQDLYKIFVKKILLIILWQNSTNKDCLMSW